MPFSIRPYQRFPVYCSATYSAGPFQGQGTGWNLSCIGWRLSGNLPMRPGESLSLTVTVPNEQRIIVPEVVVRWSRGQEFAVENVKIESNTHARLQHFVKRLIGSTRSASVLGIFILSLILPSSLLAGYSSMCASYASDLESAARDYESAESKFRRAKSNFESACGSYGFSRDDEFACGQFGYIREEYRSAAKQLKSAASQLQSVMSAVSSSCGIPEENSMYLRALAKAGKDNEELRKRVLQLEQELERYRQGPKPSEETPSVTK